MARLSLSLLGPFQAALDGQPVLGFQSSKVRALLAILATEADQPHARESLAALLWPDYPDALTYLRNALSNLRQVIGDATAATPFLLVTRQSLQLNLASSVSIDLREFHALAGEKGNPQAEIACLKSALDLFRSPFLDGLACDSDAFEEWALAWRERTTREQREALYRLSLAYAQSGEYHKSIQTARRLLELEPWDEAAHRLVMQGLAKNAQRGAALAQYEACRRVLREALQVEPSAETQALAQSIREEAAAPIPPARPPSLAAKTHLPTPLTSFIGREHELAEVRELLGHTRLLTLCGAGGCGKTRLAVEIARRLAEENAYTDGVVWVDLTPIGAPDLVLPTIVAAFGLPERSDTPLLQFLLGRLRERECLILLDNSEHLVEAVARLAQSLLEECPGLHIFATSREPIGVPGEVVWRVPSLAVPEAGQNVEIPPAELRRFDAVRLFEERARAALPGWSLEDNPAAVAEICAHLDGIPLAIELAAARVRVLSVEQINARMGDLFHLLTGGGRTALPRHQTLRACIDWSYTLLSPPERALLRRLSVFSGGWTLEAAEAVGKDAAACGEEVLDLLTRLVDRSLVVAGQPKGQEVRYRLLDAVRQYARGKLAEAGEEEAALRAHLAYFLGLAVRAEPELRGPDQVRWQALVRAELPNLRAALEWSLQNDPTAGMRIAGALHWFWQPGFYLRAEGAAWLERCLAADAAFFAGTKETGGDDLEHALARGWALNTAIWFRSPFSKSFLEEPDLTSSQWQSPQRRLEEYQAEALALFQALGKPGRRGLGFLLCQLAEFQSDVQRSKALLEESLAIFREENDAFYAAEVLVQMGTVAKEEGDYFHAAKIYAEELSLRQAVGDLEGIAWAHYEMGLLALLEGGWDLAQQHAAESLSRFRALGYSLNILWCIRLWNWATRMQGDLKRALLYTDEILALGWEIGEREAAAFAQWEKGITLLSAASPLQAGEQLRQALLGFERAAFINNSSAALEYLAYVAADLGQPERAARLFGAATRHKRNLPDYVLLFERTQQEHYRALIRSALEAEAFAAAYAEGEAMTFEQAVAYALEET